MKTPHLLALAAAAVFGLAACEKTPDQPKQPEPKKEGPKDAPTPSVVPSKPVDPAKAAEATKPPAKEPATDEVINAPVDDAPAPPPAPKKP
jgi:hypothetical protein